MTPVFAYYADLVSRTSEPDHVVFNRVAERLTAWFETDIGGGHHLEFDGVERFTNPSVIAAKREKLDPFYELYSVQYRHPNRERTLLYRLQVDMVRVPQGVQFALKQDAHTLLTGMEPLQIVPLLPPLLRVLAMEANLQVLGETVPVMPLKLEEKFVGRFVDASLVSATRVLPVIAISPHPETGRPIVSSEEVLMATFGLGTVVDLLTKQATYEISNRLGKEWSCYNGAVRIYWPNLDVQSDNIRKHPIFFPDHYPVGTQADLCANIFLRLASAALSKFNDPPKLRVYRQAAEKQRQDRENARILELTAGVEKSKELTALLQQLQKERDDLKKELVAAQQLINEQGEIRSGLQQQWADYGRQLAEAERAIERESRRADTMARRVLPKLDGVREALVFAQEDFGDVLKFLPSAIKSATDSPFARPERIYELFRAMAHLQRTIRSEGSLGTNLFEAFKPFGFEYKDKISVTAATKFGSEYTFTYEGKPTLFEHHVTIGSGPPRTCISVHWIHDERTRQFAIGWCGNHLTNTRT